MKTTIVLDNFPRTNISITTFFVGIKNNVYIISFVAMVTKLKNLS